MISLHLLESKVLEETQSWTKQTGNLNSWKMASTEDPPEADNDDPGLITFTHLFIYTRHIIEILYKNSFLVLK